MCAFSKQIFLVILQTLSSKTIELDNHKAEWSARLNEMSAKHKNEMATEKEKMLQVHYIVKHWFNHVNIVL